MNQFLEDFTESMQYGLAFTSELAGFVAGFLLLPMAAVGLCFLIHWIAS